MTKLPRNFPRNMTFLGKHRKEGEIFNLLQISQQISMVTRKLIKRYQKTKIIYAQQSWSVNINVTKLITQLC